MKNWKKIHNINRENTISVCVCVGKTSFLVKIQEHTNNVEYMVNDRNILYNEKWKERSIW